MLQDEFRLWGRLFLKKEYIWKIIFNTYIWNDLSDRVKIGLISPRHENEIDNKTVTHESSESFVFFQSFKQNVSSKYNQAAIWIWSSINFLLKGNG